MQSRRPMTTRGMRLLIVGTAAAALFATPVLAQAQLDGIIVTNQNGQLTVKTPAGDKTIALPPSTRVRSVSGPLGGQKEEVPTTALIPGLPVHIDLDASGAANDIEYKAKDYKTAAQIQAGVQETARREAELRSAYSRMLFVAR